MVTLYLNPPQTPESNQRTGSLRLTTPPLMTRSNYVVDYPRPASTLYINRNQEPLEPYISRASVNYEIAEGYDMLGRFFLEPIGR